MKTSKTLSFRLLILFFTSILLPLLLLIGILSSYFHKQYRREQEQQITNILYSVSTNISTYTDDLMRLALAPHTYENLMSFYSYVQKEDYDNPGDPYKCFLLTRNYTQAIQSLLITSRADVMGIGFVPIGGPGEYFFIGSKEQDLAVLKDYAYGEEDWYQQALTNDGNFVFTALNEVPYYRSDNTTVFSIVLRIRDVYQKRDIGILKVDATAEVLGGIFDNLETTANSLVVLADQNQNIIASTEFSDSGVLTTSYDDNALKTKKDTYQLYHQPVAGTPWELIYFSSQKDMKSQTYATVSVSLLLGGLITFFAYLLFARNSNQLTGPLQHILAQMREVEHGNLDVHINETEMVNDEFRLIAARFNTMVERLKIHIKSEYQEKLSRRNAEYRALQSQINPHFLYNTLNSFITLNRIGEKARLEKAILELAKMFRYICSHDETCSIAQEFEFVEQYLMLQKMRYEERILFSIHSDKDVENVKIPKLIIQPLVENAIKHGMEPTENPITIKIRAQKCSLYLEAPVDYAVITVSNDGLGFDPRQIPPESSVGLTNVQERLELFNANSFFHIRSGEEQLTTEYILVPIDDFSKELI